MRNITVKFALVAALVMLSRYGVADTAVPQSQANLQSMTVAELEKAGDQARGEKDYELAMRYFRAALRKDSKNADVYNKMGMTELRSDNIEAAREDFAKAAKYNPKFSDAVNNLGATYYMRKNYGSAAKYFKRAVALDETRPVYHVNLGASWFAQKKLEQSLAEYTRALELDPDALRQDNRAGVAAQIASPEERARYSYMLAKIYARRGDIDDCLQCLRRAKEDGFRDIANVYKDEEFARLREDPRLHDVVPPPVKSK